MTIGVPKICFMSCYWGFERENPDVQRSLQCCGWFESVGPLPSLHWRQTLPNQSSVRSCVLCNNAEELILLGCTSLCLSAISLAVTAWKQSNEHFLSWYVVTQQQHRSWDSRNNPEQSQMISFVRESIQMGYRRKLKGQKNEEPTITKQSIKPNWNRSGVAVNKRVHFYRNLFLSIWQSLFNS